MKSESVTPSNSYAGDHHKCDWPSIGASEIHPSQLTSQKAAWLMEEDLDLIRLARKPSKIFSPKMSEAFHWYVWSRLFGASPNPIQCRIPLQTVPSQHVYNATRLQWWLRIGTNLAGSLKLSQTVQLVFICEVLEIEAKFKISWWTRSTTIVGLCGSGFKDRIQ